jgi:VIT1/CCC1 family predicted Fe2+/Mn2+ transporter
MALSERERRLLAEMEAALASDDPRLQSTLTAPAKVGGSLIRGAVLLVAGFITLFTGLIAQIAPIGIAGFAIALVGLIAALKALTSGSVSLPRSTKGARRSFNDRIQDRWDRRTFE